MKCGDGSVLKGLALGVWRPGAGSRNQCKQLGMVAHACNTSKDEMGGGVRRVLGNSLGLFGDVPGQ